MSVVTLPGGIVTDPIGSIISWPPEDFFMNFWRFCSISSLQAVSGNTIQWNDGRTPSLPIGQPISLSALVPGPGDRTPALKYYTAPSSNGNDSDSKTIDAATIPFTAIIDYQWRIQIVDYTDKSTKPPFKTDTIITYDGTKRIEQLRDILAVPGIDYTIVSGNLNSKQLTIIPTPGPNPRALRVSLLVNLWWPSRERQDFQIPKTQGTPESHANKTTWLEPTLYFLQSTLTSLVPETIPKVPTDDLYSKFSTLCSIKCPDLGVGSFPAGATAANNVPIGQPLSLTSYLPPMTTEIPKLGLPLLDGTSIGTPGGLPLGTQVELKWRIQTADYLPGTPPNPADFRDARPSQSHSDLGGRFEVVSGGLTLPALSFIPWPESGVTELKDSAGNTGRVPSQKRRAFQIRLEVTLTAPTRQPTTFFLPPQASGKPQYFVGHVDSWATTFGAVGSNNALKLAELPKTLADLNGAPDPMQFLRSLFTTTMGDMTPDPGHLTNMLVAPTDKAKQLPSQIKEIVNKKPSTKIEAAIDLGAAIDNVAKGALGIFGVKSDNNPAAAAALNVLDILTNIFAIPIAVDISGNTVTQTLTPLVPIPIPTLESVSGAPTDLVPGGLGSPAIIGQVPIGNLKALVGTCVNDLRWTSTDTNNSVKISRLQDTFGLSFLPIPVFQGVGSTAAAPRVAYDVKLRLNVSLPGSTTPITLDMDLTRIELRIPVVSVPQILGLTRFPLDDGPYDMAQAYYNESLWFVDPATAKLCPNIGSIQAVLTTLGNTLKAIFRVIKPTDLIESQLEAYSGWTSLANTISMITSLIASAKAVNPAGPHFIPAPLEAEATLTKQIGYNPWYGWKEKENDYDDAGVSGILWIGAPQSQYGLKIHLDRHNLVDESIWLPSAYGFTETKKRFPARATTEIPYSNFSFTTLDYDASRGYPAIWLTRVKDTEKEKFDKSGKWPGDFEWGDTSSFVQFKARP